MSRLVVHGRVVWGSGGGPDKTILSSPRFLDGSGYRMLSAYMREPDDAEFARIEELAQKLGAPLVTIDECGPLDLGTVARVRALCSFERPSIWHGHDYKSNLYGLLARRVWPMRLATTVHGWVHHTWRTRLFYVLDRLILRRYDLVCCVSEDLYARCRKLGIPEHRCVLLPNAVDITETIRLYSPEEARSRMGVTTSSAVIGAAGRLSPEKGFDRLIRAAAVLLREDFPDAEFWIIGEGPEQGRLQELITQLGLEERVKLLGQRSDMISLYQAMDAFVLSSEREGLPNVVLEAMAMEVPVVATRVGGVAELVRDGETGVLVETGSVEALDSGLRRLMGDEEARSRWVAAGRRLIEREYSFAHRMHRLTEHYDRLLDGRDDES